MDLYDAVKGRFRDPEMLPVALNQLTEPLVSRFNSEVSPELLGRLPSETLPIAARNLSAFRSRVSALIEYSLINLLSEFCSSDAPGLHVTHNVTNQFGDFFIRDSQWIAELRLDVKTLHDESAEASARFDLLQEEISESDDYLLYVPWQWSTTSHEGVTLAIPVLLGALFIPAIEVAAERDLRQILSGGSFNSSGRALARSGNLDTNFGKINRLVHQSRRSDPQLTPRMLKLLQILDLQVRAEVTPQAGKEILDEAGVSTSVLPAPDVTASTEDS